MMVHCLQMILPTQCHCLAFDGAVQCLFVLIPEHMHSLLPCYGL